AAESNFAKRNEIHHAIEERTWVLHDVAADPALSRKKSVCCVQRGHGHALFLGWNDGLQRLMLIEKAPTRKITDFNSNLKGVPAFEADDESTLIYFGDYANLVDEHRGPLSFKIKRIRHNTMTSLENVDEFDIWHWAQVTTSN
ncbi:hypothetical protein Tco_0850956, partial [Tanacetum coccineum]